MNKTYYLIKTGVALNGNAANGPYLGFEGGEVCEYYADADFYNALMRVSESDALITLAEANRMREASGLSPFIGWVLKVVATFQAV